MKLALISMAALAALSAIPASAQSLIYTRSASTGEILSPGSNTITFNAGAGAGDIAFILEGYWSLDGATDPFGDTFSVTLNNTLVFQGSYVLGGIGTNVTTLAPAGATINPVTNGLFQGGSASTFIPLNFINGSNTLTFGYAGLPQGSSDEAWGINSIRVNGQAPTATPDPTSAVPEPSAWAFMILGFGAVGGSLRRRRRITAREVLA